MQYTPREKSVHTEGKSPEGALFLSLEPLIRGLGMALIELNVFLMKKRGGKAGGARVRAVVYKDGAIAVDDCSRVHRSIMPRLDLAFPGQDVYLEVSSPGIDRLIKDGSEFAHYIGRGVACYRTDISDWTAGTLFSADDKEIKLLGTDGETILPYEIIAKARLDGGPQYGDVSPGGVPKGVPTGAPNGGKKNRGV